MPVPNLTSPASHMVLLFFVDYNPSFAGSIPSEIGNLSLLEFYSTTGNFHTGEIPTEFGLLTNLVALSAGKFTVVEARIP